MICARTDTSSAETGSSSTMSRVSVARARAIAMRCRWPPLNSCGNSGATSRARPTSSSTSPTRASTAGRARSVWISSGSAMMSRTRMRGLSELNGSWKPPWTARRYAMSSAPASPATSRPSNRIEPAVGASCNKISFEVVVLPQPDSPMRPSVSPDPIAKSTPSTAFTEAVSRERSPRRTGKCFFSPRTSRTGGAMFQKPAACDAAVGKLEVGRLRGRAALHGLATARMEGAPGRKAREVRRLPGDRVERLLAAELRHRAQQRARVRMLGIVEQLLHRRLLDDLAGVHHRHPIAHLRDDAQVVRHEDQRHAGLALDVLEQVQVLRLDRHVEVGGGLVGDDQAWPAGKRDRADDALAHAAAHLVRIVAHPPLGRRDPYGLQEVLHAGSQRSPSELLMEKRGLGDLPEDREERVQRRHRVLEDHCDPPPAHAAQLALALLRQLLALEAGGPRQEADDRQTRRCLAAPRFPDEPERLAGAEREAHTVHRLDDARPAEREEVCPKAGHFQNGRPDWPLGGRVEAPGDANRSRGAPRLRRGVSERGGLG